MLADFLEEFAGSRGFGAPFDRLVQDGPLKLAAASYLWDGDLVRVWYVSDGWNFAFVTFVGDPEWCRPDLSDAEAIVRSIRFGGAGPPADA